jgi:transposase
MLKLTEEQLDWICGLIPDAEPNPKGGRPRADKRQIMRGIFWILDNGAKWKDLPARFGSKSTAHRWFKKWVECGVFERILGEAGKLVEAHGEYRLYECFIDGTFCKAKSGGDGIGCTKVGKGVKIMVLVDAQGLPVAVDTAPANSHESTLVQQLFTFVLTEEIPDKVIGDKAYDSDKLDAAMKGAGVEMIAPHRANRLPENKTQDGRQLRRFSRRWTVERTIAWLQNYRRLCIRWEKSSRLFQGYLHLGCALLLLGRVLG